MATPAFVQINEGTGKKLAADTYTENSQVVLDQKFILGENYLASYSLTDGNIAGISIATLNDHVVELMAGASLNVRIRYMRIEQIANATTGGIARFQILRLTTAGTGGGVLTPSKMDTSDAASGATAMTLPTAKGTESTNVQSTSVNMRQSVATSGSQPDDQWEWYQKPGMKPLIIPAGAANGICIKIAAAAVAGATVSFFMEFTETTF